MNYLLDTHAFLWFIADDPALSTTGKALIENPENAIYLSIASVWELGIKVSLGKLEMPSPFHIFMDSQLKQNSISLLGIDVEYIGRLVHLPFHHRDPFDRLIIAQSLVEAMPIIGKDEIFDAYGVKRLW